MLTSPTLEKLQSTDAYQRLYAQAQEELAAERLWQREQLVAEKERIAADRDEQLPALRQSELKSKAELERAEARLQTARDNLKKAAGARMSVTLRAGTAIGRIDGELRSIASPKIAEAQERLRERAEEIRRSNDWFDRFEAATNPSVEDRKRAGRVTNIESINEALTYICDVARPRLNELEITAIADDELATEIESIFDAIPKIEFRERKR